MSRNGAAISRWDLPDPWEWTKLGEAMSVIRGASPRPKGDPRYFGGTIPWIMIADVTKAEGKYIYTTRETVTEAGAEKSRHLPEGALILSNSATVCVPKILGMSGCIHDGFVTFPDIPNELDDEYLYHFFRRLRPLAVETFRQGMTQVNLNTEIVRNLELPIPPLAEQRRIVSKIESLQERSSRARRALSEVGPLLEQFRQSVLRAAFSGRLTADWRAAHRDAEPAANMVERLPEPPKPSRAKKASIAKIKGDCALSVGLTDMPIPETWSWTPLTRLGQLVTGHTPSRKHPEYWDGDVAWIGIKDARNNDGRVIEDTLQHVTELGIENSASRMLPKGTVLMTRTANSIGYSVVLGRDMATSQDLVGWILPEEVNPKFVMYLILAEHDALYRFAKGSAHPTVYFPEILSFHVALPPTDEQNEIVNRVEEMLRRIEEQTEAVAESESSLTQLDQSILAKAFRGELVPQDPRDEPASELLARIRTTRESTANSKKKTSNRKRTRIKSK